MLSKAVTHSSKWAVSDGASRSAQHHGRDGQGGVTLYMVKAVMGVRGEDIVDLAKANLWQ